MHFSTLISFLNAEFYDDFYITNYSRFFEIRITNVILATIFRATFNQMRHSRPSERAEFGFVRRKEETISTK